MPRVEYQLSFDAYVEMSASRRLKANFTPALVAAILGGILIVSGYVYLRTFSSQGHIGEVLFVDRFAISGARDWRWGFWQSLGLLRYLQQSCAASITSIFQTSVFSNLMRTSGKSLGMVGPISESGPTLRETTSISQRKVAGAFNGINALLVS